jgi:hypothetical protein
MRTVHLTGVNRARQAAEKLDTRARSLETNAEVTGFALLAQGKYSAAPALPAFTNVSRAILSGYRTSARVGAFTVSVRANLVSVEFDSRELTSFALEQKVIRRGETAIAGAVHRQFGKWLTAAPENVERMNESAAGLRTQAQDNRNAADASRFEQEHDLGSAVRRLASVEAEIAEEARLHEEREIMPVAA